MIPKAVLLGHDVGVFSDIGSRLVFPPALLHRWLSSQAACTMNTSQLMKKETRRGFVFLFTKTMVTIPKMKFGWLKCDPVCDLDPVYGQTFINKISGDIEVRN